MSRIFSTVEDEAIGNDSFLDVVSNIVGILIILVMITGSRARSAAIAADDVPAIAIEQTAVEANAELRDARRTAQSLSGEVSKLTREASRLSNEVKAAEYAQIQLGTFVATAEHELGKVRGQLDDKERRKHDLAAKLVGARRKLDEIQRAQISVVATAAPEIVVKTYPSPISATVFTKEEHYRLLGKRIARVPFEELKDMLLDERRQLAWKLEDLPEVNGSVGPRDGFRLDFHFVRTVRGGSLTAAYYVPVQTNLGVTVEEALSAGSQFRADLARLDRANTTVTLWTYPDSFDEFRQLRKELYQLGFSVAGRPLDKDGRIGFSPTGSKSQAQ